MSHARPTRERDSQNVREQSAPSDAAVGKKKSKVSPHKAPEQKQGAEILSMPGVLGVALDQPAARVKPKFGSRKKAKFGRRGKIIQEMAGYREFREAWLANMLEEMSAACDRFWAKTPERRKIEAARLRSGFNYMTEK